MCHSILFDISNRYFFNYILDFLFVSLFLYLYCFYFLIRLLLRNWFPYFLFFFFWYYINFILLFNRMNLLRNLLFFSIFNNSSFLLLLWRNFWLSCLLDLLNRSLFFDFLHLLNLILISLYLLLRDCFSVWLFCLFYGLYFFIHNLFDRLNLIRDNHLLQLYFFHDALLMYLNRLGNDFFRWIFDILLRYLWNLLRWLLFLLNNFSLLRLRLYFLYLFFSYFILFLCLNSRIHGLRLGFHLLLMWWSRLILCLHLLI